MDNIMIFPNTVEEFMEQHKVIDTEQIYSNGMEFVPIFRMRQWFEHLLGQDGDYISRDSVLSLLKTWLNVPDYNRAERNVIGAAIQIIGDMPTEDVIPVTLVKEKWQDFIYLIEQANNVIESAKRQGWISVEERLPEFIKQVESDDFLIDYSETVLVFRPKFNRIELACYALEGITEYWLDSDFDRIDGVAYWMPLPEPPKEGDAE